MHKILAAFLGLLCAPLYAQPQIVFRAQPERVQIGDSVVLSWQVRDADAAYLTNYGRVELAGQLTITPEKASTTLTLIAHGAKGLATASVTIVVEGGRGEVFPNENQFSNQRQYEISALSPITLLDGVHSALQNKMGFVVDERYDRHAHKTVFVTKLVERPELLRNDDSGIRARQLAYWVEVEENKTPAGSHLYRIKTFIQYQRRKENKWRPEPQEVFYRDSADRLWQNIQLTLTGKGQ